MYNIVSKLQGTLWKGILKLNYIKEGERRYAVLKSPQELVANKLEHGSKIGKKYAAQTLEKLFNLKKVDALMIASKYKTLGRTPPHMLSSNFHFYKSKGIKEDTLMNHPELLAEANVLEKVKEVEKINLPLNDTFPLMKLDYFKLKRFVNNGYVESPEDKIRLMSNLFEQPIRIVCGHIASRSFLLQMDSDALSEKFNMLRDFGITIKEISSDLWVLRYSKDAIQERLEETRNRNLETVKTWMVRAPSNIVDRYVKRRSDNKLILGNHSLAEYLSERLDCSVQQADYLITKHPALENKSLKKMQEIIDFLYSYGFKPFHICRVPKILLHSVETTKKRLKELQSQGLQIESLSLLTKSQKQYMQYYESLGKSNKLKNKS